MLLLVDPTEYHKDVISMPGVPVTIPCLAHVSKSVEWQTKHHWEHTMRYLYADGEHVDACKGRCAVSVDESSHYLTIHEPKISDAGEYWCIEIEKEGHGMKHITQLYVTGTADFGTGFFIFIVLIQQNVLQ